MKQNSFLLPVSSLIVLFLFLFSARADPLHDPVLKTFPQRLHNRAANSKPVLDLAGNKVQTGYWYQLVPAVWPNLGPVSVTPNNFNFSCIRDVIQAESPWSFRLAPVNSSQQVIQTGVETNIFFFDAWCRSNLYWRIGESNGQAVIRVGPGWNEADKAEFIIEKSGMFYTFSHCDDGGICRYVGSYFDGKDTVHLALTEYPFLLAFRRDLN